MTHTAHNINIFFKVCEDHVCIKVALHNPTKPRVVAALWVLFVAGFGGCSCHLYVHLACLPVYPTVLLSDHLGLREKLLFFRAKTERG